MNIVPDDRRRMMDEGQGKGREKRSEGRNQRTEVGGWKVGDGNKRCQVSGVGNGRQPATLTIITIKPEYRNTKFETNPNDKNFNEQKTQCLWRWIEF
jgi:hypothetical protein